VARFHEVQRFRQPPVVFLGGLLTVAAWAMAIDRVLYGHTHGVDPAPTWIVVAIWLVVGIGLPLTLLTQAGLVTDIDARGISVRFAPLSAFFVPFSDIRACQSDIRACQVVTIPPLEGSDHWGVRTRNDGSRAFIMRGGSGVMVALLSGGTLTIGSQRSQELAEAIAAHLKPSSLSRQDEHRWPEATDLTPGTAFT